MCDESGKVIAFQDGGIETTKGETFCVRPSMETAEEDEMDPAHFKFGVSKGDT